MSIENRLPNEFPQMLDQVIQILLEDYVYPEKSREFASLLKTIALPDHIDRFENLTPWLNPILREMTQDGHVGLRYHPVGVPPLEGEIPQVELLQLWRKEERYSNYGFEKVEVLKGNVGYLKLNCFEAAAIAAKTGASAMAFLENTDALIIDLRENGGGDPEMVHFLCSYFFLERTHLNDMCWRPGGPIEQYWTLSHVPGERYLDRSVYVLTSNRTASGAEGFSYDLKNLKRAVVVGEVTAGAAHPGYLAKVHEFYTLFVPQGRPINPVTGGDWERVGVQPDVVCTAAEALNRAYVLALQGVQGKLTDADRNQRKDIENALSTLIGVTA